MNQRAFQNGNVLFIVLAGIALFAALVMAVTRSGNTDGSAVLSQAQAKTAAASIMRFGSDVEQAVNRLQTLHGCEITEISFERSPFDGSDTDYVNSNSPSDNSCHVFHPSGGQVEHIAFEQSWQDTTYEGDADYGDFKFVLSCVEGVGIENGLGCKTNGSNGNADLVFIVPFIKQAICENIELALNGGGAGVPIDPFDSFWRPTKYQGSLSANTATIEMDGDTSGCYEAGTGLFTGAYMYYNLLYAQ